MSSLMNNFITELSDLIFLNYLPKTHLKFLIVQGHHFKSQNIYEWKGINTKCLKMDS